MGSICFIVGSDCFIAGAVGFSFLNQSQNDPSFE
jgi:hypothetical protein